MNRKFSWDHFIRLNEILDKIAPCETNFAENARTLKDLENPFMTDEEYDKFLNDQEKIHQIDLTILDERCEKMMMKRFGK